MAFSSCTRTPSMSISQERISRRGTEAETTASRAQTACRPAATLAAVAPAAGLTAQPVAERVSTLELFFDLVFVFTVTQLTSVLTHEVTWSALGHVMLMLGVIWWMYAGYAWLTNAVS